MRENRPAVLLPSFRQAPTSMADAAARFSYERLSDDGVFMVHGASCCWRGSKDVGENALTTDSTADLKTTQNVDLKTLGTPRAGTLDDVRKHYRSDPKTQELSDGYGNILSIPLPYELDLPEILRYVWRSGKGSNPLEADLLRVAFLASAASTSTSRMTSCKYKKVLTESSHSYCIRTQLHVRIPLRNLIR